MQSDQEKLPDEVMAAGHLQERREGRYALAVEIDVSGIGRDGEVFHQHTVTRDVSEWGCGFVLQVELRADDMIALHVPAIDESGSRKTRRWVFQVRRVSRTDEGWLVGAWKMEDGNVWGMDLERSVKPEHTTLGSRKMKVPGHADRPGSDVER